MKTLAGLDISEDEIVRILTALGFEVSRENGCLKRRKRLIMHFLIFRCF